MRKTITFLIIFLLSGSIAFAQNAVRGIVSDKTGSPLPGVTVKVKGTQNGTQTDANGHYSINAAGDATLVFSYIGYVTQEVPVNGRTSLNVVISDAATGLNEVVVIGYGTQKKATVTGAISSVSAEDLKDQQITRLDDALQGRAAGVIVSQSSGAPGSAPKILVRGANSFLKNGTDGSSQDPLYVIDGTIWDNGGYDAIDPNDIESIQVLKDASAAIYGSRSSNGVILVTTKKGKLGAPKLTYDFYYGTQNVAKKLQLANASQYAMLRNEALTNDGGAPKFSNTDLGVGTNWQDEIFGSAPIMDNHLQLSGATETANYFVSLGYLDQKGIVTPQYSDYKRMNFRVNTSFQPKKYIKIGENFEYTYTRSTTNFNTNSVFGGPLSDAINLDPLTPVVVTDPTSQPDPTVYTGAATAPYLIRNAQGYPYGVSYYVSQEIVNPIAAEALQNGNYGWSHNLFGDAFAEIDPIKGLSIKTEIAAKQAFYGNESFTPLYYLNTSTKNTAQNNQFRQMNSNLEWNWDNTISYTRSIQKHNFTILLGESAEKESHSLVQDQNFGEPIFNYTQASFDFNLPQGQRYGYASDDQPQTHASLFGRLTYDYDQKYLLQVIVRRDGSSKFGSDNVYGTFPSISAGWVATKEDWFPKNTFVDYLKVRASYGVMGNEKNLGYFQYSPIVGVVGSAVFGAPGSQALVSGYAPNALPNPALRWEQDKQTDIAIDATLFHDFTLTLDYYNKQTDGLLLNVTPPGYAGVSGSAYQNAGGITNKGVEVQLGWNKKVGDFSLNLNGNIAYNKNKVTSLGNQGTIYLGKWQSGNPSQMQEIAVGQPIGEFYGYKVLGIFQSQSEIDSYVDANGAKIQAGAKPGDFKYAASTPGALGPSDRQALGSPIPSWTYGYNFAVAYKQFDLSIFGQGVWGNKIFQEYRRLDIAPANYPIAALNAWTPTNTNTSYPRLTDADPNKNWSTPSSFFLQSGAYMRIKSIQLGYNFPKSILNTIDISKLRVYVSGDNLFTITKYNGFDPEVQGGDSNYYGVDQGVYPLARTFRVGVDVTF